MIHNRINRLVLLTIMICASLYYLGFTVGIMTLSSNMLNGMVPQLKWETVSSIDEPIEYLTAEVVEVNDREFIYLIGGEVNGVPTSTVYFAEVLADGTLSKWQETLEVSQSNSLSSHNSAVVGEQLYVMGGDEKVFCTSPSSDGSISNWIPTTPLTYPLTNFSTAVVNERIYIIGGWSNGESQKRVVSGVTTSSCGPIEWSDEPSLLTNLSHTAAGVVSDDFGKQLIVVVGGWIYPDTQHSIYVATVNSDNNSSTLGGWKLIGDIEQGVIFHSLSVSGKEIFIIGGTPDDLSTSNWVYRFQVNEHEVGEIITSEFPIGIQKHDSVVGKNGQIYVFGGKRVTVTESFPDINVLSLYTPLAWLSKSNRPSDEVYIGEQITYTIYYTNNNLRPLTNVIITDEIPANSYLVDSDYPMGTRVLTWTIPVLDMNESGVATFAVRVMPPLTAFPPEISTPTPTPTAPQPDSDLHCSTSWSGGGGTPRPTCTPTATPMPLPTTPVPPTIPPPRSTRYFDLTPIPVINQAWLCEEEWCIQSNMVINTPYRTYLPIILR